MAYALVLFLHLLTPITVCFAAGPDVEMRMVWVKNLKGLLAEIEKKESENLQLTVEEKRFLEKIRIIDSAWADSRFDCFYGGWPSTLVSSGDKKLCQSPKARSDFSNSPCAKNQLRCQPLLFGPSLCTPFETKEDRVSSFSSCEKIFLKNGSNYDYLNQMTPQGHEELREISVLAGEICRDGRKGTQKDTGMCRILLQKMNDGLHAIDRGWRESVTPVVPTPVVSPLPSAPAAPAGADCVEPEKSSDATSLSAITALNIDQIYEIMKEKFQSSPFCDPMKVVSNPAERANPFLLRELYRDMSFLELLPFNSPVSADPRLDQLASKYQLKPETQNKMKVLLGKISSEGIGSEIRKRTLLEMRVVILQDFSGNATAQNAMNETVRRALSENRIFSQVDGKVECPFVSKDAFQKAMEGRSRVLAANGESLTKRDQLTIVDYSRPSNERRMFMIDLSSGEVLHNTWVAHGGGNGNGPGRDGFGSSPEMSNQNGSNLSSDGFLIASGKSSGRKFGPNVLLRGIDKNNRNMAARSIILHGWSSPMDDFTNGVSSFDFETQTYAEKQDPCLTLRNANAATDSTQSLERTIKNISSSTWMPAYLMPTEGCLGVPAVRMSHLDKKGRQQTQLELMRDDLPGSLIFNYSGPAMTSSYFP